MGSYLPLGSYSDPRQPEGKPHLCSTDLNLLARVGTELSVMFEMNYAPQDNPERFVGSNPEGSQLLIEIAQRLTVAGMAVPDEMAFLISCLPKRS